jgi:hypothetical protein
MTALSDDQRVARMRRVWQGEAPSEFEVEAARQRYIARSAPPRQGASRLALDLVLGMAVAGGVLLALDISSGREPLAGDEIASLASDGVPSGYSGSVAGDPRAPTSTGVDRGIAEAMRERAATPGGETRAPHIERSTGVFPAAPGVVYEVALGETVTVVLGDERSQVVGPKNIEFSFEADRASGFRMYLSDPTSQPEGAPVNGRTSGQVITRTMARGAAAESSVKADEIGSWSRAAEALRSGNRQSAEKELTELSRGTGAQSDAAALALAQLWIAAGETARARPVLERLRESGHSALVRRRASELLIP